jgi:hypothetical protein
MDKGGRVAWPTPYAYARVAVRRTHVVIATNELTDSVRVDKRVEVQKIRQQQTAARISCTPQLLGRWMRLVAIIIVPGNLKEITL